MYTQFLVGIQGDILLLHNGQLADPLNKYAKAMKQVSGKRNKSEEDFAKLADIEFEGSLYVEEGKAVLDSRVLEAAIAEGAKVTKEGKKALTSVFVDTSGELTYRGGPLSVEELVKSDEHRLTVGVRVQRNRVMRTRPLFRDWSAEFKVSLLTSEANADSLHTWLENAGRTKGVGDYRPRYGRFAVSKFEQI